MLRRTEQEAIRVLLSFTPTTVLAMYTQYSPSFNVHNRRKPLPCRRRVNTPAQLRISTRDRCTQSTMTQKHADWITSMAIAIHRAHVSNNQDLPSQQNYFRCNRGERAISQRTKRKSHSHALYRLIASWKSCCQYSKYIRQPDPPPVSTHNVDSRRTPMSNRASQWLDTK